MPTTTDRQLRPAPHVPRLVALSVAVLLSPGLARGEGAAAPAPEASARPLLEQLNRETQSLYQQVRSGTVRVQLPPPRYLAGVADCDNPIKKWGTQLDPRVRQQLSDLEERSRATGAGDLPRMTPRVVGPNPQSAPGAATQPAAHASTPDPGPSWQAVDAAPGTVVLQPTGDGAPAVIQIHTGGEVTPQGQLAPRGPAEMSMQPVGTFAPNSVGLVLDSEGRLLVPRFVEREALGADGRAAVSVGDGPVVWARFFASDAKTDVTILQLERPAGTPVRFGAGRPADGSLVLLLSPNAGVGRLVVWNAAMQDYGVVVGIDGSVAGFARYGQFLATRACEPVARQLIAHGVVKRPTLGMNISAVARNDPLRDRIADLGLQPAVLVEDVRPDSSAARAGLRRGDLILGLGDQPVGDPPSLAAVLSGCNGVTAVRLLRDGHPMTLNVELRAE